MSIALPTRPALLAFKDKEPSLIIGTVAAAILAVVATFLGAGFISDALAGKAVDLVTAVSQLFIVSLPIIQAILTRQNVYAPATVAKILGVPVNALPDPPADDLVSDEEAPVAGAEDI